MNFLNEVAERYPVAISFASGRPTEALFDIQSWLALLPEYVIYHAERSGRSTAETYALLAQYGRTNGLINELIAKQIGCDHSINCTPAQIIVTSGCQEAINILVASLCDGPTDVIMVRDPCYIGITGAAKLNHVDLVPFLCDDVEQLPDALYDSVKRARLAGKRPRVLYLVPDFDNPTGSVLSRQAREAVIEFCSKEGIFILEDNPYGLFRYEGENVPAMYALDRLGTVIFLGTYSKTLCPTLRIGYAVVPDGLSRQSGIGVTLLDRLSQIKSFGTVNTSQITQAIVGAVLLREGCSLHRIVGKGIALYRHQRDIMLANLVHAFNGLEDHVKWNAPAGGFFLCVELPFDFGRDEVARCAEQFGVLVMPLSFFSFGTHQRRRVRLAFSYASEEKIADGIARFAAYVRYRLINERNTSMSS
ncbi:PLP-dependent aminotransferase family protein [Massilia aurea]|uniref:aminotransferase-like domain-containing protein n=1 Tax=Massilia aurea TaxID=373040 RepID=UPI0021610EF7|nr:PLP-dependent aminotransferase family protein [Massilia aurea]MCS0710055.1 PLP-dependent aminotransferase family protein [Massilia aurea]